MGIFANGVGFIGVIAWVYLLFGRGRFWQVQATTRASFAPVDANRAVAIIIPARNEAEVIYRAVRSLVDQEYRGRFHVFVVDDASSDNTAAAAMQAAVEAGKVDRLTLIQASHLPKGWTGKVWALSEGVRNATSFQPDYFLFSDADIVHPPDQVTHLIAHAESGKFDLVSLMVKLSCHSVAERMLIPSFVFFFLMLYPPAWVATRNRRTAAAAGGCILIRANALAGLGGLSAIRDEIIDDCALARRVKRKGHVWLGVAADTHSVRSYASWADIERMISRTAFTQLGHSPVLLAGTILAMALTYLAPPLLLIARGPAVGLGLASWLLMAWAFFPTLRYYRRSPFWALLLPVIAAFYLGATIHSAIQYWRGNGGFWKGRVQDPVRS